jgi:hypothetical protein
MNADDRHFKERLGLLPFENLTIVVCSAVIDAADALTGNDDVPPIKARAARLILRAAMKQLGCGTVDDLLDVLQMPTEVN